MYKMVITNKFVLPPFTPVFLNSGPAQLFQIPYRKYRTAPSMVTKGLRISFKCTLVTAFCPIQVSPFGIFQFSPGSHYTPRVPQKSLTSSCCYLDPPTNILSVFRSYFSLLSEALSPGQQFPTLLEFSEEHSCQMPSNLTLDVVVESQFVRGPLVMYFLFQNHPT